MYRAKYRISKDRTVNPKGKKGPGKDKGKRGHRYPSYGKERRRKRAYERDYAFLEELKKVLAERQKERAAERERDRQRDLNVIARERAQAESDDEDIPPVPEVEVQKRLHVCNVNLHIEENTNAHHTDEYECTDEPDEESDDCELTPELVIRRGQEFLMTIEFDRPYDIKTNDLTMTFDMGDDYKPNSDICATFRVNETGSSSNYKPKKWGATVVKQDGKFLTLSVFCPASCPVGEWEFSIKTIVDTDKDGKKLIWQYDHNEDINIIFNPWCKEDWVYMENEKWRNEAVLNENGAQYYGSYWDMGARGWFFGQFQRGILNAAFHLVRMCFGFRACPAMGNPATVARMISQIVNSQDDCGVLTGNWSGDYEGGVKPTKWTGSVKILLKYMETKQPVAYGQCWVFSGVTTTVCRALGLPCRSVTNYASAHNTDTDRLSIDIINKRNALGEWIEIRNDSCWNFHVWNEVWMARPDLSDKKEWDGWQAIDATPQEYSDGVFCCGPAPVKAIKEGMLQTGKDTAFIFAEVNADKCKFQEDPDTGVITEQYRLTNSVGKNISTHKPTGEAYGGDTVPGEDSSGADELERLDLTNDYKYEEGSPKEREIVKKAERMFRKMNGTCIIEEEEEEEEPEPVKPREAVKIKIERPISVYVGNPFGFKVNVTNVSSDNIGIKDVVLKVFYKTYFDTFNGLAEKRKFKDLYLDAGQSKCFEIEVDADKGCAHPEDCFNFELQVAVSFYHTSTCVTDSQILRLRKPDVKIQGPKTCRLRDKIPVEISFTNPLNVELKDCEVEFEGGFNIEGLTDGKLSKINIPPKKTWKQIVNMMPKKNPRSKKDRAVSVGLDCKLLEDIVGFWCSLVDKN